ncbi:hypothetical protein BDN72DRAFT_905473 [Pluteus cervinus]|uniref:Uncharacterized protein n=1 Tax=Pluteus cervinus TaxID=181527 RepID=A0ACD3A2I5_9AGAR|nr:hypothetical protein BDN72DRAFT_905473 [Pluteus cervinus]
MPDAYAILTDCLQNLQLYSVDSDSVIISDEASLCDLLEALSLLQLEERLKQIQYTTAVEAGDVEHFQQVTASGQENLSFDDLLKIFMAWSAAKQQMPPSRPSVCRLSFDVATSSEVTNPPAPIVTPSLHSGNNFASGVMSISPRCLDNDFMTLNSIASPEAILSPGPGSSHFLRRDDHAPAIAQLEFTVSQLLDRLELLEAKCEKYDAYTRLPERQGLKFQHDRYSLHALDDLGSRVEHMESVIARVKALTPCQGHADPGLSERLKEEILQVDLFPRCSAIEHHLRTLSRPIKLLEDLQTKFAGDHEFLLRQQGTIGDRLAQLTLNSFSWEDWKTIFRGLQNYVEDSIANLATSPPAHQVESVGLHLEISHSIGALDGQTGVSPDQLSDMSAILTPTEPSPEGTIRRSWEFLSHFSKSRWALALTVLSLIPFVLLYYPAVPDRTPQPAILPASSVGEGFMIQRDIYDMCKMKNHPSQTPNDGKSASVQPPADGRYHPYDPNTWPSYLEDQRLTRSSSKEQSGSPPSLPTKKCRARASKSTNHLVSESSDATTAAATSSIPLTEKCSSARPLPVPQITTGIKSAAPPFPIPQATAGAGPVLPRADMSVQPVPPPAHIGTGTHPPPSPLSTPQNTIGGSTPPSLHCTSIQSVSRLTHATTDAHPPPLPPKPTQVGGPVLTLLPSTSASLSQPLPPHPMPQIATAEDYVAPPPPPTNTGAHVAPPSLVIPQKRHVMGLTSKSYWLIQR